MKVRAAATKIISAILRQQGSLNTLLPRHGAKVADQDQALLRELCFGCMRWYPQLTCILDQLLKKPFKEKDTDLYAILLLAIYQLAHTRIPAHAAINEAVATTKAIKKPWASGLINGVLRNYQRNQPDLEQQLSSQQAYRTAHPEWFVTALQQAWPDHWQAILEANNQHPPMTLRVNTQLTQPAEYCAKLKASGIDATETPHSPSGITLSQPVAVTKLPDFDSGAVSVQDEAPQLAAHILQPGPNNRVLDACCAPGGKLMHLAELMDSNSVLHGVELEANRLPRVEENLTRLKKGCAHLPEIKLFQADAQATDNWWDGTPYQKILLDAPCSATGVIRRNPDIKVLRTPQQIEQLSALQLAIASALWPLLEPGGQMLYATCSSLPAENDQIIAKLAAQITDLSVLPIEAEWGVATTYGRQLFPVTDGHDGFYYALLEKPAPAKPAL